MDFDKIIEYFANILIFSGLIGLFLVLLWGIIFTPPSEAITSVNGTGSMKPTIMPSSKIGYEDFNGTLRCGHIYIYEKGNITIVHRFVYQDGGLLYFQGDNNGVMDDPVTIDQVKYHVYSVIWGER